MLKKLTAVVLSLVLVAFTLGASECGIGGGDKFDRTIAALQTAPALINSFSNSSAEEKAKLSQYFADGVTALRAYKASKTDGNWTAFLNAFGTIARGHVSDSKGMARISAIVGLVRVLLGIPEPAPGLRMGKPPQPNLKNIKDSDIKQLEELMKPLS